MPENHLSHKLQQGLRQLDLPQMPDEKQQSQLVRYIELLHKWNKAYNLTAVRDPLEMVTRHLLDSLAICACLRGKNIIDVGTGAGLPGIPLAIVLTDRHFTLLDSNSKKTRFIIQVVAELELGHVDVVQSRVEQYQPPHLFDTIVTRAYSSLADMVAQTGHLLSDEGVFLAMKGLNPVAELEQLDKAFELEENYKISVPGLEEQRHLLQIKRSDSTV